MSTVKNSSKTSLRILTDTCILGTIDDDPLSWLSANSDSSSSANSLFDEPSSTSTARTLGSASKLDYLDHPAASRTAPPIPGLFAPSVLLPSDLADEVMRTCMDKYFRSGNVNQVMLFGRAIPLSNHANDTGGLPSFLTALLSSLSQLLRPELPTETYALLFPPPTAPIRARQAILNLYTPGEGISPHVDLLGRFGDGIVGVSFGSGCTMSFRRESGDEEELEKPTDGPRNGDDEWHLYLPERSIVVLSGDARYRWTHGIQGRMGDLITDEQSGKASGWIERGTRMSITFRWLLPGADVVGDNI